MKYLCEGCNQLVMAAAVAVRDGAPALVCPSCGAATRVGEAPPASPAAPAAAAVEPARPAPALAVVQPLPRRSPAGPLCPKCAAPRPEAAEACSRCGLVFALFDPSQFALSAPLEDLWTCARGASDDPAAHEAFLEASTRAAALGEAARRYRLWAEEEPAHALAVRFREEAVSRLLATTRLPNREPETAEASVRRQRRFKIAAGAAVAGIAVGLGLYLLILVFSR